MWFLEWAVWAVRWAWMAGMANPRGFSVVAKLVRTAFRQLNCPEEGVVERVLLQGVISGRLFRLVHSGVPREDLAELRPSPGRAPGGHLAAEVGLWIRTLIALPVAVVVLVFMKAVRVPMEFLAARPGCTRMARPEGLQRAAGEERGSRALPCAE
jgi:hypothetical protein